MSLDDRDYYYDPKLFRNGNRPKINPPLVDDDAYWRKKAIKQQELIRNLIILGVGIIALIWFFGGEISRYWKSFSFSHQQNTKVAINFPEIISPRPSVPELPFPESGSIIQYQKTTGKTAKFTVISAQNKAEHCLVKLEKWSDSDPLIELFVRVGEQAETQAVPLGDYRVKIACGKHWYGRDEMFGRETTISIGETPLKFWQTGNKINGNILTLTEKINGNFRIRDTYYNKF